MAFVLVILTCTAGRSRFVQRESWNGAEEESHPQLLHTEVTLVGVQTEPHHTGRETNAFRCTAQY